MILAKGARPRAIFSRLAPMVIGAGLLAGCQSARQTPPPEVRADAWRVVERVGEARYLAPGTGSWAAALPATALPDGSQVTTGAGGRLILARANDQVSAGPGSQFSLPDAAFGAALEQTVGRLRYRLAEPPAFAVATPALAIEIQDSVFEVRVGADATEVAVERGRLRVATLDGQREIDLAAGQSAEASGHQELAFRRAGGQPLEPVERLILPALEPKPAVAAAGPQEAPLTVARATADQGSTSATAGVESAVPVASAIRIAATGPVTPTGPVAAALPVGAAVPAAAAVPLVTAAPFVTAAPGAAPVAARGVAPAGSVAAPARTSLPTPTEATSATMDNAPPGPGRLPVEAAPTIAPAPAVEPTADATGEDRGLLFDRLSEGMIDAVPAQPAPQKPSPHARSL